MDARLFLGAIRSTTVTYPIPYLVGILLLFALLIFGGGAFVHDWYRVLLPVVGAASTISAFGLIAFATWSKPELLRSERHGLVSRVIDLLDDGDMDLETRAVVRANIINGVMEESVAKKDVQTKLPRETREQ